MQHVLFGNENGLRGEALHSLISFMMFSLKIFHFACVMFCTWASYRYLGLLKHMKWLTGALRSSGGCLWTDNRKPWQCIAVVYPGNVEPSATARGHGMCITELHKPVV